MSRQSRNVLKMALARRLKEAMDERDWTSTDLVHAASEHLPSSTKLSTAHLWHYLNGRALPRDEVLQALLKALSLDLEDVERDAAVLRSSSREPTSDLVVEDLGDGFARIRLDQRLPWAIVVQVLKLIKEET